MVFLTNSMTVIALSLLTLTQANNEILYKVFIKQLFIVQSQLMFINLCNYLLMGL